MLSFPCSFAFFLRIFTFLSDRLLSFSFVCFLFKGYSLSFLFVCFLFENRLGRLLRNENQQKKA
ncbi:hypothetical protein A3SI_13507 [Nitritalea halalkaliphila LW7]|uniref:Uncharacterized protein n=1 Tax=Nitritalea halalkaliphila LW7 TaxID=1189621 RepID=I5C0R7_9BACT|nr:hypothetical protein A3SI_13507 [Nitritalea halalkaliphila LW7]